MVETWRDNQFTEKMAMDAITSDAGESGYGPGKNPASHGSRGGGGSESTTGTSENKARAATSEELKKRHGYLREGGFQPQERPIHKSIAQSEIHHVLERKGYKYYGSNSRGQHVYLHPSVSGSTNYMPSATVNPSGSWDISAGGGMNGTGKSKRQAEEMLNKYPPHQPSRI